MSVSGPGLAFLPQWLNDATDSSRLESLFFEWVQASSYARAGLICHRHVGEVLSLRADEHRSEVSSQIPVEVRPICEQLAQSSRVTLVVAVPKTAGRLYARLQPAGHPPGVLWVEREQMSSWTDSDHDYLALAAKLIERSPLLLKSLGFVPDAARIQSRLQDTAVVASRMAHDFDNVLTGVMGFSDLSLPLATPGSQLAKWIGEIAKAGQRGMAFTKQLHELSRSGQAKPQPGSLTAVIAKEEAKLRSIAPMGVHITSQMKANMPNVAMDVAPLGIIFGHLLSNAVEACPQGGKITITAEPVELSSSDASRFLGAASSGAHVQITIQDTGAGFKPDAYPKLFAEPFYTTKVGHRGLGLAIVYRTLACHFGGIRIEYPGIYGPGAVVRCVVPVVPIKATTQLPKTLTTTMRG